MTHRATRAELDQLATIIDKALGLPPGTYHIQSAYGRPRLFRNSGSVEVSPRLPSGRLAQWMHAYIGGINAVLSKKGVNNEHSG